MQTNVQITTPSTLFWYQFLSFFKKNQCAVIKSMLMDKDRKE